MTLALTLLFTLNLYFKLQRGKSPRGDNLPDWPRSRSIRELFQNGCWTGPAFRHGTVTLVLEPPPL